MKREMLSCEEVRDRLKYDPATGGFKYPGRAPWGRQSSHPSGVGMADRLGYHRIAIGGKQHLAHRLAWLCFYGEWPPGDIDHINGDPGDNRICNLRIATRQQNQTNRACQHNNALGKKCIHKINLKCGGVKFRVRFNVKGRSIHIGCFDTLDEAVIARDAAMLELHGEFARKDCDR